MTICKHLDWVHVGSGREMAFINSGRLDRIVGELSHPATQKPSIVLFAGRKYKTQALRELFPNHVKQGRNDGPITLQIDNTSIYSDFPVLFVDSDPFALARTNSDISCHEVESFPIKWATSATVQNFYDILYARVLCPFTDVLCIFADDFPNFNGVVDCLKTWAVVAQGSKASEHVRPSVVIVKQGSKSTVSSTFDLLEMQSIQSSLDQKLLRRCYSSIKVLQLADEQISPMARFRRLKEILRRLMDEMRNVRSSCRYLYSALHLNAFFQSAVSHTATTILQPFNFIKASRIGNEVSTDYKDHLKTFLHLASHYGSPDEAAITFIASSILLDAYPPRMHRFDPIMIYNAIYHGSCFDALVASHRTHSSSRTEALVWAREQETSLKRHLATAFAAMDTSEKGAARIHQETTRTLAIPWPKLQTNRTCLWCLRRGPEICLSCGHAICSTCVQIFGEEIPEIDCQYEIQNCLLCWHGSRMIRLRPATAGERILTIDGGGTRGVIPLDILDILQGMMGSELRVQDLFDLAFGTSVGGLIICILFLRGMPPSQCVQTFDILARKLFERPQGKVSFIKRLRLTLKGWYRDGHYDANALEDCLKTHLGREDRMFGFQPSIHATKVGVVAATIGNASPVIFTNYNGLGKRASGIKDPSARLFSTADGHLGYTHIRPDKIEEEPCIWEAGRGTSAAPVLYRSAQVKASGPVQDGAMSGHNNPIRIALSERSRNDPTLLAPDVVLSLGTGTRKASDSPTANDFRHVILDGYVPRLWRSYMSSFNGEKIWEELINSVNEDRRSDYIRLNSILPRNEPAMDDPDRMDEVRQCVRVPQTIRNSAGALYALVISSFYFQLTASPERIREGQYQCQGMIRCRLPGVPLVKLLSECTVLNLLFTTGDMALGRYGGQQDLCKICHRYRKKVDFTVRHPTEVVTIYAQSVKRGRRKLSAFPQAILWFQDQQKLNASFGTSSHQYSKPGACKACRAQTPLKRRSSGAPGPQVSKRLRIGSQVQILIPK